MLTRRRATIGLLSLAVGSAAITSGSFLSSTAAGADLRVTVTSELTLTPARENSDIVVVNADGEVTSVVITQLNARSISTFEQLIEITNNGDVPYDRIAFEVVPQDQNAQGDDVAAADAMEIIAETNGVDATTTDEQGRTTLLGGATESLSPGESVTFGLAVNLIASSPPGDVDDLPNGADVTLEIIAISE